jgi:hypothetical protein
VIINEQAHSLGRLPDTLTWTDTITVSNELTIPSGTLLLVYPGSVIIFRDSARIIVNGGLQARGNVLEPIQFKGPGGSGTNGNSGIRLMAGTDSVVFEHCHFTLCGTFHPRGGDGEGAVVIKNRAEAILRQCSFKQNKSITGGGAIRSINSGLQIIGSHFQANSSEYSGGALEINGGGSSIIMNSTFIRNTAILHGGAARITDNLAVIQGNLFLENTSIDTISPGNTTGQGGALSLSHSSAGATLIGNILENNRSNSALYISTHYSLVANNLISNNAGVGLFCGHSASLNRYVNNTICYNENGGIVLGSSGIWIGNGIIAENGAGFASNQVIFYADTPVIYHSCITGGYLPGYSQGVMDADPLFVRPAPHTGILDSSLRNDWRLQAGSPCLDAGNSLVPGNVLPATDLSGAPRVSGQEVDLGAYEHQVSETSDISISDFNIQITPNPAHSYLVVRNRTDLMTGKMYIIDITGNIVRETSLQTGHIIDIEHLLPGIYICRILLADGSGTCQKIIKH